VTTPVLDCAEMGHRYGRRGTWGLRECTLTVPAGRVVALVGPNGAGKTTLLHLAAGLLPPTEGSVKVAGAAPGRRLERIGFVAQDSPLWPRLRVDDVLGIGAHLNPRWDKDLASERIARLSIPPRARIGALSGGQRAQVALTLVLAKRPELLLLDEPLANLDPLARREFLASMFDACTRTGAAVLFSSHVVAELERICDYLVVLADGRVRLAGDIDELRRAHRVIAGPAGWPATAAEQPTAIPDDAAREGGGGWRLISPRQVAGRTSALVRVGAELVAGPGLEAAEPTFDELVIGYLDQHHSDKEHTQQGRTTHAEAPV
jgi:ABC-2 type transport system ATP-binding protein